MSAVNHDSALSQKSGSVSDLSMFININFVVLEMRKTMLNTCTWLQFYVAD